MGQVYRATDARLKRQVAIKVLPPSLAVDVDRLARFQREAEVLASLNHPNIATIYGLEESEGTTALVMELVEGDDLSKRIARGAIPLGEALPIAKQIAEALEAAHEQGIVHRDLTPASVKVRGDGTVKVLDFGLAKAMDPVGASAVNAANSPTITSPVGVTGVGTLLGTAAYMSPEQAVGKDADRRSDMWAFGVVLLEMLTGRPVFAGETVSHVLAAVLKDEADWTRLPVDTPPAVRRLLRRCLDKDRKQRLDSATAARLEIVDAFTSPRIIAASSRRERVAWLLASTALIVAVGSLAGFLWTGRRPPPTRNLRPVRFDVITPSSDPSSIALSPDGGLLAFVAAVDGAAKLW